MNDLRNYVNRIADELRFFYENSYDDETRERCEESGEPYDLYSYFDDVLDIEYTISGNGDFLGCRLAVALGGPNVYVDTRRGEVEGYWGTEHEAAWIPSEICDEINCIFEECYNCLH